MSTAARLATQVCVAAFAFRSPPPCTPYSAATPSVIESPSARSVNGRGGGGGSGSEHGGSRTARNLSEQGGSAPGAPQRSTLCFEL